MFQKHDLKMEREHAEHFRRLTTKQIRCSFFLGGIHHYKHQDNIDRDPTYKSFDGES